MKISDSKHRLKSLLRDSGDTQNEMARKTGLTKSAISNYINGTREPRQDAIYKISEAYDVSPSWLMGLDVPKRDIDSIRSKLVSLRLEFLEIDENDVEKLKNNESKMKYYQELLKDAIATENDIQLLEKGENSKEATKALLLYQKYQQAPPHIQAAIESLLKGSEPES